MYVGHLLIAPAPWLAAAVARRHAFAGFRAPAGWSARGGDPVFLLADEEHVGAYARVQYTEQKTLAVARAKFGEWLAGFGSFAQVPLYSAGACPGEMAIDVPCLSQLSPIEPVQGLRELGIPPMTQSFVRQIEPEEVLMLLKVLPPPAQGDWTKRVVARENDIPRLHRGGATAG